MKLDIINQQIKEHQEKIPSGSLAEKKMKADPFEQFVDWFQEVLSTGDGEPTAMVLATIDKHGLPDTRVVLLKELADNQLIFYSHYKSKKAKQISMHPVGAVNFYWPHSARQVRIRGQIEKLSREKSELYFATRPRKTQIGAHAWNQSAVIANREVLEKNALSMAEKYADQAVPCPRHWGGYVLTPFEYEFFQRRRWRMHDRFLYTINKGIWKCVRLAP